MSKALRYQEITTRGYVPQLSRGLLYDLVFIGSTLGRKNIEYYHYTTSEKISYGTWSENQAVLDKWNQNRDLVHAFGKGRFPTHRESAQTGFIQLLENPTRDPLFTPSEDDRPQDSEAMPKRFRDILKNRNEILVIEGWHQCEEAFESIFSHFVCDDFEGDPLKAVYPGGIYLDIPQAGAFPVFSTRAPKH